MHFSFESINSAILSIICLSFGNNPICSRETGSSNSRYKGYNSSIFPSDLLVPVDRKSHTLLFLHVENDGFPEYIY